MRNYNVTVIPGDGIGPEIVREIKKQSILYGFVIYNM